MVLRSDFSAAALLQRETAEEWVLVALQERDHIGFPDKK